MSPSIYFHDNAKELLEILGMYLPLSIPLVRRLQFTMLQGGRTPNSQILASFERRPGKAFVVAYLDFSRSPETEMWLFSSVEDPGLSVEDSRLGESQLITLFGIVGDTELESGLPRATPGSVLLGSVHERVLEILQRNRLVEKMTVPYRKFIFHISPQPSENFLTSEEFLWGPVRERDLALVLSRTKIPRKEKTLVLLPSVAIRTIYCDSPIAWGFLGPDGSLTSLHCEGEYRGRGLAKAVTSKLFQEHLLKFGPERLAHADVALDNTQSQGVCKSLGATEGWTVYWANIRTISILDGVRNEQGRVGS